MKTRDARPWGREERAGPFDAIVIGSGIGGMTAAALLKTNPKPTTEQIEAGMSGNICRCGTYHRIREAVALAAK